MTRRDRKRRACMAREHLKQQRERRQRALEEAVAAAKASRKGPAKVVLEMKRRGYRPVGDGWKRMPKDAA